MRSVLVANATEHGDRIRAAVLEAQGKLPISPHWEEVARRSMLHLQFTDCRSLSDHLTASVPRQCEDKRLSIEMAGLRQSLWEDDIPTHVAYKPHGDQLRWIPTHLQLADCLTKSMKPLFNQTIDTNVAQVRDVPSDAPGKQSGLRKTVGTTDETAT